jgi:hypothetical protein
LKDLCKNAVTNATDSEETLDEAMDLSQPAEELIQAISRKPGREGEVFMFPTKKVEVFNVNADMTETFFDLVDSLCRKENPDFPSYHEKTRKKAFTSSRKRKKLVAANREASDTTDNQNLLNSFSEEFDKMKKSCYEGGYNESGSIEQINLPLDAKSVHDLTLIFFEAASKDWSTNGCSSSESSSTSSSSSSSSASSRSSSTDARTEAQNRNKHYQGTL